METFLAQLQAEELQQNGQDGSREEQTSEQQTGFSARSGRRADLDPEQNITDPVSNVKFEGNTFEGTVLKIKLH